MAKFSRYERHLLRTYSKKYHIPAHILAGQIEVESDNQPGQVSSAGAFGRTQFIPSTARSYGVKRGDTRRAVKSQYRGQAKYLADLGGGKDRAHLIAALGGYYGQQGTDYPSKVLGAAAKYYKHLGGGKGGKNSKGRTVGGNLQGKLKTTPGRSFAAERQQARLTTLSQAHGGMPSQNQLLSLAGQLSDLQDQPGTQILKLSRSKVRHAGGGGGGGAATGRTAVKLAPGADRPGVKTSHYLRRVLSGVRGIPGGITITTGSNHNQMTVNGNQSDHWTGHAGDIAVPVDSKRGDLIAGRVLMRLGVPRAKARQMARQGGLFNVQHGGKRWQVIWKTNQGGNHHNHVHVGVK